MDENNSNDDKQEKDQLSPRIDAKKPKIDDEFGATSSNGEQVATQETTINEEKCDNVDSGIAGENSENVSLEDETTPPPRNHELSLGLSAGDISLLRNFMRSTLARRNYRRHESSDDSESESRDSDDVSPTPASVPEPIAGSPDTERTESDEHTFNDNELMDVLSTSSSDTVSEDSAFDVDSLSGGDPWTDAESSRNEGDADGDKTPSVLLKPKARHNWFLLRELISREMNLTTRGGQSAKTDVLFEQRYYGSLHAVQRLRLMHKLNRHKGCVNAINFHPEGHLLASGSDDLNVIVWDWALNKALQLIKTGHKSNVFQSKFLHLNAKSQLNIVTCARDGQVRLLQCPASGGVNAVRRRLHAHRKAAHKLHTSHLTPHQVYSAGEDAKVIMSDVRSQKPTDVFTVHDKGRSVPLYSIHGHPLEPHDIVLAGRDSLIRVFDTRRTGSDPKTLYCPSFVTSSESPRAERHRRRYTALYVTCAVYNYDGSEILASYNDDDIYLFDTKADVFEKSKYGFTHRYSGHRNHDTFKGVAFFGPRSEFVISGSDCSNIYIWEKSTESIVQWMPGDDGGIVNCLESHPRCPVLATSGIDKDVKIWAPTNFKDPEMPGLKERVKANYKAQLYNPLFEDFLPHMYTLRRAAADSNPDSIGGVEFEGNVCSVA